MLRVGDVMSSPVVTASLDTPFPELVDLLLDNDISSVPIVDAEGALRGIVTEADLVTKEAFAGRRRRRPLEIVADLLSGGPTIWVLKSRGRTARDVMTATPTTARADETVRVAARRMIERRVKRLPVVDGTRLVGIVSRSDILGVLQRDDAELRRDVDDLLSDPLRAPEEHDATATVDDGVVHLSGSVLHPWDVPVLEAMVWRLPGVVDVTTDLSAREPNP